MTDRRHAALRPAGQTTWTTLRRLRRRRRRRLRRTRPTTRGDGRVDVTSMENVIATGLGAVDYLAAGSNDPELVFNNQQNHYAYDGDLDLRGTEAPTPCTPAPATTSSKAARATTSCRAATATTTSTSTSARSSRQAQTVSDGVDVIHRQVDANGDNLWDGTVRPGLRPRRVVTSAFDSTFTPGPADHARRRTSMASDFSLGGTTYTVDGLTALTLAAWLDNLEAALARRGWLGERVRELAFGRRRDHDRR